jgi:AcrR family transcriptional regulator
MARPRRHEAVRERVGHGGRQLDPARDPIILRAALEGVAERGYDRLTMDEIAKRAHAGKGALYRRWPSKAALVVDAIADWRQRFDPPVPDTGSLQGDLEALVATIPTLDEDTRLIMSVSAGLWSAVSRDPELAAVFSERVIEPRRQLFRQVLERGVERGEVAPDRDLDLITEIVFAVNFFRFVLHQELPDEAFVRRFFDQVIFPLATAPVRPDSP